MVEIQAGLVVGEQVVVSNNELLMNGDTVQAAVASTEAEGAK